jgi:hypothetical protein
MTRKEQVSFDAHHGLYHRTVGMAPEGRKPKFWLGPDKGEAARRAERLEFLWCQVEADWKALPAQYPTFLETEVVQKADRPLWDDLTLAVAKVVAKGGMTFPLPRNPSWSPYKYTLKITDMQRRFRVVSFTPAEGEAEFQRTGAVLFKMEAEAEIHSGRDKLAVLAGQTSGQTWHQALDTYAARLEKLPDRSGWYKTQIKQTRRLKEHHPDMLLAQLGLSKIEEMVDYWRHRPVVKGKVIAATTARNEIIQLGMVLKWLDRSDQWDWQRPRGFEDINQKVKEVDTDRERRHLPTFTLEDLTALWTFASPLVRLQMALALNCGFKYAEIASLSLGEISLSSPYPGIVRNDRPEGPGNWIVRYRRKTGVYGEWKLWGVTAAGIEWAKAHRQAPLTSPADYLLVTRSGRPMDDQTSGGNKSDKMYNSWRNLYKTVAANHGSPVQYLAFKFLEKTATQWLRDKYGGEVANLFCAHGKPVKSDGLLEVYSNKPFGRLFKALDELGEYLRPVFEEVPDSWRKVRRVRTK